MNEKIMKILVAMSTIRNKEYNGYFPTDQKVLDCIWDMYFYMICSGHDEIKQEEYFKEFEKKFDSLDKEQQEEVKQEYINIIEAQNKNKEKEKVKKKGMINNE